jgi:serine/threonine protein kinase
VDVTPDAKNFILSIIRKDPRDRIEIDEILNHPFLRNNYKTSIAIDFKL